MQQLFKLRVADEFLESAPVLLAGFRLKFSAYCGQIQRAFAQLGISGRFVMNVFAADVPVFFVFAHIVH